MDLVLAPLHAPLQPALEVLHGYVAHLLSNRYLALAVPNTACSTKVAISSASSSENRRCELQQLGLLGTCGVQAFQCLGLTVHRVPTLSAA